MWTRLINLYTLTKSGRLAGDISRVRWVQIPPTPPVMIVTAYGGFPGSCVSVVAGNKGFRVGGLS